MSLRRCVFQTTLQMFRNKTFTVRRRFSDFLGLYEKLSEKHGPNGFIVPPPPEKSLLGRLARAFVLFFFKHVLVETAPSAVSAEGWGVVLGRDDEGEGGEGGFVLCRLCGEKKRRFGEVTSLLRSHGPKTWSTPSQKKGHFPPVVNLHLTGICSGWWITPHFCRTLTSESSWRGKT